MGERRDNNPGAVELEKWTMRKLAEFLSGGLLD